MLSSHEPMDIDPGPPLNALHATWAKPRKWRAVDIRRVHCCLAAGCPILMDEPYGRRERDPVAPEDRN